MSNNAVAIAAIVMTGVFLSVVAWQLLSIARTAVARDKDANSSQLHERLTKLEELHKPPYDHQVDSAAPRNAS